jgi:hypothetical protein
MDKILHDGTYSYEILDKNESVLRFNDVPSAVAFLRQVARSPTQMAFLRGLVASHTSNVYHLSTEEILKDCAVQVVNGRIRILSRVELMSGGISGEVELKKPSQESAGGAPAPEKKAAWVEFRVLNDETGQPVAGEELIIQLPDARIERLQTDIGGHTEIYDTVDGNCEVRCELGEARPSNVCDFIRMG